uniref:Uncharacterized protein n=1 Tax=Mola mola TaxID=94237 RepID=A0A3Q3XBS1_MOLML
MDLEKWVWVDSDIGVAIGARVKVTPSGQRVLVDDEGKEQSLSREQKASLRTMHPMSVEGVEDMIKLGDMTEAGLLRNLLLRHKQGLIYTYIGSVLVAMNPYKEFPLYSSEQVRLYHGRKREELPPHIFALAESCYSNMTWHHKNQCCIISGESGAGKTESTKLILKYLAAISGERSRQKIEQQILESNPILEAFGNAKTIRNDNSSRFGKYLEIFFNTDGVIEGACVEQYLLEKSRVCHQALEERNYHMFYCMLAGVSAEEKAALSLGDTEEYTFLTKGGCILCEGRDDAKDYKCIRSAMDFYFSEDECRDILKLLAAILHLGNVCFQGESNTLNNLETSDVGKSEHFNIAASLLGVNKSSLATSLTHRSFMTNREHVTKPLSSGQASDCRDAFVKAIYNKLFVWIVRKINSVIYKRLTKSIKSSFLSIGLLDIFGFENFSKNSFEQLCINFANEKLQQFFVRHIFKLEQKEYLKEDIVWKNIKFKDNKYILDLLAGKPCNVLALIDEESHFPKGSDLTMLQKMNQNHTGNKLYIASKRGQEMDFGIHHFAGVVNYNTKGFLEKNRDAISFDIIQMVDLSTNQLLHRIFETKPPVKGLKISKRITMTPRNSTQAPADSKQVATLSGQFRQSLDCLMKALSSCHPFFIRCFKPNNTKQPHVFDRELCMHQLRYCGILDTICIRKRGYPIRYDFADFLNRYRALLNTTACDPKTSAAACCEAICRSAIQVKDQWKMGKTKIFLKDACDVILKGLRERELRKAVVVIQTFMMAYKDRSAFLRKRRAAVVLQKHWRASRERQKERIIAVITPASTSRTPAPSREEKEDDKLNDESDAFSFYSFSVLHFQGNATHTHVTHRLKQPLLPHDDEADALACLTVWWIILRFMEDLPEPRSQEALSQQPRPISHKLPLRLSSLAGPDQKILRLNKKLTRGKDFTEDGRGEAALDRPLTPQEKLHVITGYGLSRKGIRDEIYCQICKQLMENRSQRSLTQGWILMSVCLGIFPPTDLFMKHLERFVLTGPTGYDKYCSELLRRINANGERKKLPCWIELEAAKSRKPINVSVALMDGRAIRLRLDPVSTSAEVCRALAKKINLQDTSGFSLYISIFDKMWSLGSCGKHVLDAVSQCEQEMKKQGKEEKETPWSLSVRKELFTPWHDCSLDPTSTDLIYEQVIKGMESGEYTCEKDEYVHLAVQHYYIRFGPAHNKENIQKVVEECISAQLIENKSMSWWIELISAAYLQGCYAKGKLKTEHVKAKVVNSARQKWPLYFSKFYEVTMISGPPLPRSRFAVAVNCTGILFVEGKDKKLLELPYIEIKAVHITRVVTVGGEYVLECEEAADMTALVEKHLDGLREQKQHALSLSLSRSRGTGDPMFLICKRGDLLLVKKDEESPDRNWIRATSQRTNNSGAVYKDKLQFLPTLTRPSEDIVVMHDKREEYAETPILASKDDPVVPFTLGEFALENFRPSDNVGRHHALNAEMLWVCSREPLRQPLMKSLVHNSLLSNLACNAFNDILKYFPYMGNYPVKQTCHPIELTDQIFGPATLNEVLQDEIYCQILKQMTGNSSRVSMDRGWQLVWLCLGLFPPSQLLVGHIQSFLVSRPKDQLAAGCLQRLQEIRRSQPRKFPPHVVELDAIRQNSTQIFHKIHFPDDTDDIIEVASTTTVKELSCSIASKLRLSSAHGYGLYVKTSQQVSLDEEQYFFDGIRQASDFRKRPKRGKEGKSSYWHPLFLHRKLWFNVKPGKDLVADITFHFPQELPKYLKGFHNCTKEDTIHLGGLLFRIQVDSDSSQFVMIPEMLKELVPADHIQTMSPEDWKKHIISSYNKQGGITVQEAKIAFLKATSSWPTFGCAFFEVKQNCESSYPNAVLVVISKQGVSLVDPQTKEVLILHPFSRITDCDSNGSYFHLTISTIARSIEFICETLHVTNLVRSYITMYEDQIPGFQSKSSTLSGAAK